jgi:hypothetical protein
MVLREFVRCSLRSMSMLTIALAVTSAGAMPLSDDVVGHDVEMYGTWNGKFKVCEQFFHETEAFSLARYNTEFHEQIRQDIARQLGNQHFELDDSSTRDDPQIAHYLEDLAHIAQPAAGKAIRETTPSAAQCNAMDRSFLAYFWKYDGRIRRRNGYAGRQQRHRQPLRTIETLRDPQ